MRFFVLLLAIGAACFVTGFYDTVMDPYVDTVVAVNQLDDSEAAAIAMRTSDRISNAVPVVIWGSVAILGYVLYRRDLTFSPGEEL